MVLMPPQVVAKQNVKQKLLTLKAELESMLDDVNQAIAFVDSNPAGADALIKLALRKGLGR